MDSVDHYLFDTDAERVTKTNNKIVGEEKRRELLVINLIMLNMGIINRFVFSVLFPFSPNLETSLSTGHGTVPQFYHKTSATEYEADTAKLCRCHLMNILVLSLLPPKFL